MRDESPKSHKAEACLMYRRTYTSTEGLHLVTERWKPIPRHRPKIFAVMGESEWYTVPKHLRGATLGKAHQWVRSMTDTREYALENPSGQRVSLGDLTNGGVSTVQIVGEIKKNPATPNCGCGQNPCITYGTMQNPAHPMTFTGRTFGMNRHVNLTHILQKKSSLLLFPRWFVSRVFSGQCNPLSILMARPLKEFTPVSPM